MQIKTPVAYADRRDVVLSNVKAGSVARGRENILYAQVHDLDGELIMSATLGDILAAAAERGYNFVSPRSDNAR
jgi:hypothetical protein